MATEPEWRDARHGGVTAVVLAGFLLLAGCSTEPADDNGGRERPTPKPAATGTLEELARKAGCDPNVQTDAAELRQANCRTQDGRYILTTFAADRGQWEWINEAKNYGGSYLVGRRWVAVGDPEVVAALRGRLGGTVETASPHHSGDSGGGGSEDGHSGHHPG
ncbi:hypothetical protein [Streptomyces sindenensis]|uniref:hypothetical protein n=1 Tax=Streptomyces sindenensis TaxID=67363 RepID=UPI00167A603B|nr:hypothetical protein [Streptomyces sindenensis]GGP41615.1 hypothetical protein GCM10010231_10710 [Streptomyces sindenensis]